MLFLLLLIIRVVISVNLEPEHILLKLDTVYDKIDPEDRLIWSAAYCIREFLQNFLRRAGETPLFIATEAYMPREMNIILLTMLDGNISTYILSGNLRYNAVYSSSLNAIILADHPRTLMRNTHPNLSLLCSRQCLTYIVVLANRFTDENNFQKNAGKLIQSLWERNIGNVAVMGFVEDSFLFAKSQLFESGTSCRPQEPTILGACAFDGYEVLDISKVLFTNIKANECYLKTLYIPRIPYTLKADLGAVSGVEGEIFNAVSKFVKFDYDSQAINSTYLFQDQLDSNGTYFVYGGIPWQPNNNIDFTMPYDVSSLKNCKNLLLFIKHSDL